MHQVCNKCGVEQDEDAFTFRNKAKGLRRKICKSCRNIYIQQLRAKKTKEGHYGLCTVCNKPLGRNEHPSRNTPQTLRCSKCTNGVNHHRWTGGKSTNADGYIVKRVGIRITMLEHRYVMEQHIGRKMMPDETVHHLNGQRTDNRIENLELWVGAPVRGIRVPDAVAWAKEIIKRYES